jgi:phosphate transport system permease protein
MSLRQIKDAFADRSMFVVSLSVVSLGLAMAMGLFWRARPIFQTTRLHDLFFSAVWHPSTGQFGLAGFIASTFLVTGIAITIAVPFSLLTSVYLSEYADRRIRAFMKPVIDVLGGISPVIYGVWGILVIVPLVRFIMPLVSEKLPFFPFVSENYTGFSALAGGLVLSVMVFPIVIAIIEEVLSSVPKELREASMALGANRWETVKYVVLKKARPGIVAAFILGLSRAFGETMAVLMVAGCCLQGFPRSLFDTAYPLPALVANTYGEMMSIPLYDAAVLLVALILLIVTVICNMVGWGIIVHFQKQDL